MSSIVRLIEKLHCGGGGSGGSQTISIAQVSPFILELSLLLDSNWNELQTHLPLLIQIHSQSHDSPPLYGEMSLLLSKLYYHLGDWKSSVDYALLAGPLFSEASPVTTYHKTILFKAVDQYLGGSDGSNSNVLLLLLNLINKLLAGPLSNSDQLSFLDWKSLAGFIIESERLDLLESLLSPSSININRLRFLLHHFSLSLTSKVSSRDGISLLSKLTSRHEDCWEMALFHLRTLIILNSFNMIGPFLKGISDPSLQLQCALKIQESLSPLQITSSFPHDDLLPPKSSPLYHALNGSLKRALHSCAYTHNNEQESIIMDQILSNSKDSLNQSSSMHISALSTSNAFAHLGTGSDIFLRDNLSWFQHATNWTKYTTTASLGSIYLNKRWESIRSLLDSYLPSLPLRDDSSPYSEGGSLFSLGFGTFGQWSTESKEEHARFFIDFANEYITSTTTITMKDSQMMDEKDGDDVCDDFLHGCALGLGSHFFQSHSWDLVEFLKNILYRDSSSSADAAAIAIGLIMFSSSLKVNIVNDLLEELLAFARESQHERAQRGISMAIALILYGSGDDGIAFIDENNLLDLTITPQSALRYGACWALSLCVVNCSPHNVPQRLMRIAIGGDPSDEVKRVSVMCLAFIMESSDLFTLLKGTMLGNHNANLRYGAVMALGFSFAGTPKESETLKIVIQTLKGMAQKDNTDFVRQASFLSLSIILQQRGPPCSEARWIREHMATILSSRYEDGVAKYGAILGQGIIDMGARRGLLSLRHSSNDEKIDSASAVGFMMFSNHWFFYPHALFLSLACRPSGLMLAGLKPNDIGDSSLMEVVAPIREFKCNAPSSFFATFPAPSKEKKEEVTLMVQAILSTTTTTTKKDDSKMNEGIEEKPIVMEEKVEVEEKIAIEDPFSVVYNFGRATQSQIVSFVDGLPSGSGGGIHVIKISSTDKFIDLVTDEIACWTSTSSSKDVEVKAEDDSETGNTDTEVKPPADFEFKE